MYLKSCIMLFLLFAVGYLVINLIYELIDRFIYKVKSIKIQISAEEFMKLKKYLKANDIQMSADKYLQFHTKEDIKDILGDYDSV